MMNILRAVLVASGLLFAVGAQAQTQPAAGTAAVTATCKDGTTFSGPSKKGACSGHGGVKSWTTAATSQGAAKAGGGAGKVWVNTESKVYHCQGSKWYGKTKHGEYMAEAAAKTAGFHAAQGKPCS